MKDIPRPLGSGLRAPWRRHGAFALVCGALVLLLAACSRPSDEEQLRATVTAMQGAMETGEPREFMQHVASDFTGAQGSVDRQGLHNLLRGQVLANARIGVTLGPMEVRIDGERATVEVSATMTGGSGRWLPERGAVYRIVSGWRKESGQWRCINAQWERVL